MALYDFVKYDIKTIISLSKFEQLSLCLMRLRLGTSIFDTANRFKVSKSTAARIFSETLEVIYIKVKFLVLWPERTEIQATMPMCFQAQYGKSITAIIDCFELFIERPSNLTARALIAITPQGSISFISRGWGGRTSDKHITENSGFLRKLTYGDCIMADRGFNIADTIGSYGSKLVIPAFTRGKNQLTALSIEFVKTNDNDTLTTLDKIVHASCAMVNLCTPIVPTD